MRLRLRGLTWNHPRATRPLAAAAAPIAECFPEVVVEWDVQPLDGFERGSIAEAARRYDLVIFDHPHIGEVARDALFVPVDGQLAEAGLGDADFIGPSLASYRMNSVTWGFPLDAAAQVATFRADRLNQLDTTPPTTWDAVIAFGERARANGLMVGAGLAGVHGLMTLLSLLASLGHPLGGETGKASLDRDSLLHGLQILRAFVRVAHPASLNWNSIQLQDALRDRDDLVYCPAVFGFAPYARHNSSPPLGYADLPSAGSSPARSTIGGAGLGVSAFGENIAVASRVALLLIGRTLQTTVIATNYGQPAHFAAWHDPGIDNEHAGFYSATRRTLTRAWVRPRYNGYMHFQRGAGAIVESFLHDPDASAAGAFQALDALWCVARETHA